MLGLNAKYFKTLFLFILCILLQLRGNFYCYGFSVKQIKSQDITKAPTITTLQAQIEPNSLNLNQVQKIDYEHTNEHHATAAATSLLKKCDPCPEGILCVTQIQCPAHVRMRDHEKPQACDLADGTFGFCCLTGQNHTASQHSSKARALNMRFMPPHIVEEARLKLQNLMHQTAILATMPGHPDHVHGLVFHSSLQENVQNFHLSSLAMEQIIATQVLSEKEDIPLEDIVTNNMEIDFKKTPLAHSCQAPQSCVNPLAKYRTIDGSCNNAHPFRSLWGSAGQPMERLLPPAYEDGVWSPRMHGKDGSLLPSARDISRIIMIDADAPHPKYNLMLMQFGQFLAHDIVQSDQVRLENGEFVQCCAPNNADILPPELRHFACLPIEIDRNDEFYAAFGIRCMNFVRLALAPNNDCRASYGKQRNKVSHYLDASQVYGSSLEKARELRAFKGGKLRIFNDFGRDLLPLNDDKNACDNNMAGSTCFKSGDGRTNQIISLVVIHLLFVREHNRIADILASLNPNASDELLYQEARRIVIAEIQHIIYNEYLPQVLGPRQMRRFRLTTQQQNGYSTAYKVEVKPGITNEFAGAAFRMGHSCVDGRFHIKQQHGEFDEIIHISEVMFNPSRMRKRGFYDGILNTLLKQPMQRVDSAITHELSRFMFRGHNPFGLDLVALNIQRGRDHGLRSYNDYLEVIGDHKIESFNQLPDNVAKKLSQVYRSPDDIDLWVGGLLESAADGASVGNTFSEIIADQFSRLKLGDRYYYEYDQSINPGAFTMEQLNQIRKITMARIICNNADHITLNEVSPKAFLRADVPGNQPLSCDSPQIPEVNFQAWRF